MRALDRFRFAFDDPQQHPGRSFGPAPVLLPFFHGRRRKPEPGGKGHLAEAQPGPDRLHVHVLRHVDPRRLRAPFHDLHDLAQPRHDAVEVGVVVLMASVLQDLTERCRTFCKEKYGNAIHDASAPDAPA